MMTTSSNPPTEVGEVRYYPFGGRRAVSGTIATDKQYTGQQLESLTGNIYHYGARMYNADIGRFISADTVVPEAGNPQALNRYSYVVNNPMRYNDPTGHCIPLIIEVRGPDREPRPRVSMRRHSRQRQRCCGRNNAPRGR